MNAGWCRRVLAWTLLAGLAAGFGLCVVAALDREPPRDDAEGVAERPALAPGEMFRGHWRVTYLRDCEGESHRWLTSKADRGYVLQLPTSAVVQRGAELGALPARAVIPVAAFEVPYGTPPGRAHYHVHNLFACNWLQRLVPALRIAVDYPVIPFEVLPPPASPAEPQPPGPG